MAQTLIGKGAKAEDKELASAILAGEMKNAWEVEDRANVPDTRPPELRVTCARKKSPEWYENYDFIFRRKGNGNERKKTESSGTHSSETHRGVCTCCDDL